jgi:glyoxylase I family protein
MTLGTINHLTLSVSDINKSEAFYHQILEFLGYQLVEKSDDYIMWWSQNAGAILISPANPDSPNQIHDRYSPGLHHLAFNADSREEVDNLYKLLLEMGTKILDTPAEYNHYAPGYYAVYFADPDNIKLELVHMPNLP